MPGRCRDAVPAGVLLGAPCSSRGACPGPCPSGARSASAAVANSRTSASRSGESLGSAASSSSSRWRRSRMMSRFRLAPSLPMWPAVAASDGVPRRSSGQTTYRLTRTAAATSSQRKRAGDDMPALSGQPPWRSKLRWRLALFQVKTRQGPPDGSRRAGPVGEGGGRPWTHLQVQHAVSLRSVAMDRTCTCLGPEARAGIVQQPGRPLRLPQRRGHRSRNASRIFRIGFRM